VNRSESGAQAPLSIDADLTLTRDGTEYRITATDDTVSVSAPSIGSAVSLFRSLPTDQSDRLGPLLATTDVTIVVRVDDQRVATFEPAPGWEPGGTAEFELRSFDLHPRGVAVTVARELSRHPLTLLGVGLVVAWLARRLRGRRSETVKRS